VVHPTDLIAATNSDCYKLFHKKHYNFYLVPRWHRSRDNSFGIVTSQLAGWCRNQDLIPWRGKNYFLVHSINTGSEAYPASYPSSGGEQPGHTADHASPCNAKVMNVWGYNSITTYNSTIT